MTYLISIMLGQELLFYATHDSVLQKSFIIWIQLRSLWKYTGLFKCGRVWWRFIVKSVIIPLTAERFTPLVFQPELAAPRRGTWGPKHLLYIFGWWANGAKAPPVELWQNPCKSETHSPNVTIILPNMRETTCSPHIFTHQEVKVPSGRQYIIPTNQVLSFSTVKVMPNSCEYPQVTTQEQSSLAHASPNI